MEKGKGEHVEDSESKRNREIETNDNNTKESHRGNMEKKMDSVRNTV